MQVLHTLLLFKGKNCEWTCAEHCVFLWFTWGCRALMVEGGCRGPWGRSCSSSTECLKCWSVWGCCCWGSEGRLAVCEWECVWACEERSDSQTEERRREGWGRIQRVTHWKFGLQTVGQTSFAQLKLCRWAAHPWNEQCYVRFFSFSANWCTQRDRLLCRPPSPHAEVRETQSYVVQCKNSGGV